MKQERITSKTTRRKLPVLAGALLCCALLCGVAVGGTVAWLQDTDDAHNTFVLGDVSLTLAESEAEYKMIPGVPVDKDPAVTVGAESSDCWLFVQLTPSAGFGDYMAFLPNTADFAQLPTSDGTTLLYLLADTAAEKGTPFSVLAGSSLQHDGITYTWGNDQLLVLPSVTKAMMDAVQNDMPTLAVAAYAIQAAGFDTPQAAWAALQQSMA